MKALQFRISGIPVRVEPIFFLVMALLGWLNSRNAGLIPVFMVVGGASILLHELGHATAHRSFGAKPSITLTGFGGVTVGPVQPRGRSLVVTLAGPIAGFLAALVGVALSQTVNSSSDVVKAAIDDLIWVNIVWGIFNLLPILPLDGGNVAADLFGMRTARAMSVAGAAGLGLLGLFSGQIFLVFIALSFGSQSLNALRATRDRPQLQQLDEARGALLRNDTARAVELIEAVGPPGSFAVEVTAAELLAWARLADNRPEDAQAALATLRGGVSRTTQLVQRTVALANGELEGPLAPGWVWCNDIVAAMVAARVVMAAGLLDRLIEELNTLPQLPGPPKTNGYRALQLGLHHAGRFREAARVGDLLFFQDPDPLVAYNVACSWALAGGTEEALAWLDRAVEHGFRDSALLDQDNNFDRIRETDGFRALRSWMETGPPGDDDSEQAAGA
ncbi:MAG TPA: site-2 protease family protein [Acidimicrobiales bacterium]|jgi:Zn-dependent protease|nr:site-2 protease family protein [Acidimicrobiales bacterium]